MDVRFLHFSWKLWECSDRSSLGKKRDISYKKGQLDYNWKLLSKCTYWLFSIRKWGTFIIIDCFLEWQNYTLPYNVTAHTLYTFTLIYRIGQLVTSSQVITALYIFCTKPEKLKWFKVSHKEILVTIPSANLNRNNRKIHNTIAHWMDFYLRIFLN